jgi:hypothetical protein
VSCTRAEPVHGLHESNGNHANDWSRGGLLSGKASACCCSAQHAKGPENCSVLGLLHDCTGCTPKGPLCAMRRGPGGGPIRNGGVRSRGRLEIEFQQCPFDDLARGSDRTLLEPRLTAPPRKQLNEHRVHGPLPFMSPLAMRRGADEHLRCLPDYSPRSRFSRPRLRLNSGRPRNVYPDT